MYSLDNLNNVMNLELFLYGGNPPPQCDSYGTRGMSLREIHETSGEPEPLTRDEGEIILCHITFDPKTGEFIRVEPNNLETKAKE